MDDISVLRHGVPGVTHVGSVTVRMVGFCIMCKRGLYWYVVHTNNVYDSTRQHAPL